MTTDPRHKSRVLLEGPDRAPARAMRELHSALASESPG